MDYLTDIITIVIRAVVAILAILVTNKVIPWLKEKQLYDIVRKGVEAAEKLGGAGKDKKDYVKSFIEACGITVTDKIDTYIEAAVQELDIALGKKQLDK